MLTTTFNGSALMIIGLGWYIPALVFGRGANLLDFVMMMVVGAFGFAVRYTMFREQRTYSR